MAGLSFDDCLIDVDSVSFDFGVSSNIFDQKLDKSSYNHVQADEGKVAGIWQEKSPFHQSDSGVSEDCDSMIGSPLSDTIDNIPDADFTAGQMLDDLVDSLEIDSFCCGADKDLANYFNVQDSDSENCLTEVSSARKLQSQSSVSDDGSCRNSPILFSKKLTHGRKKKSIVPKVIGPQGLPDRSTSVSSTTNTNVATPHTQNAGVKAVKVLKVIKTSGTADTASEVLAALEDRNKKNAVQAKINREKKKAYVKSLEDQVEDLSTENCQLKLENENMKTNNKSMQEEIDYLRAVLANESSLSKLLGNIGNVKSVKLSSSISSRKRGAELDHDYVPSKKSKTATAGVCLHVDNDSVSLEFCAKCSQMSKAIENE